MSELGLLVSGFGPFLDVSHNPSGALALALGREAEVIGVELPVSFRRCAEVFDDALAGWQPRALLGLGVHRGPGFRLERRAGAILGSDQPDRDGVYAAELTLGEGEGERHTILDLERLAAALERGGASRVEISSDAGGYVCERIYWHLLGWGRRLGVPAAFCHVPLVELAPVDAQLPAVRSLARELLSLR